MEHTDTARNGHVTTEQDLDRDRSNGMATGLEPPGGQAERGRTRGAHRGRHRDRRRDPPASEARPSATACLSASLR